MEYITKNLNQTLALAKSIAKDFTGGEILLLQGDLGAGKTAFTKGVANALCINSIVTSPTFTIMNVYSSGKLNLYHFDMYRIQDDSEIRELGFNEYIGAKDGVCCVEWFTQTPQLFAGKMCTFINIEKIDDNTRKFTIENKIFN